jgi:hypothetical protein
LPKSGGLGVEAVLELPFADWNIWATFERILCKCGLKIDKILAVLSCGSLSLAVRNGLKIRMEIGF